MNEKKQRKNRFIGTTFREELNRMLAEDEEFRILYENSRNVPENTFFNIGKEYGLRLKDKCCTQIIGKIVDISDTQLLLEDAEVQDLKKYTDLKNRTIICDRANINYAIELEEEKTPNKNKVD